MNKLLKLASDLRKDLVMPELPLVVGELGKWDWPLYVNNPNGTEPLNYNFRKILSFIPNSLCVSSEGLPRLSIEKDPHFSAEGQLILGKRYAKALLPSLHSVQASKPKYDDNTIVLYNTLEQSVRDSSFLSLVYDINQLESNVSSTKNKFMYVSDFMRYQEDSVFKKRDIQNILTAWSDGVIVGYSWNIKGMYSDEHGLDKNGKDYDLAYEILSNPDRETNKTLDWFLDMCDFYVIPVLKELNIPIVFSPLHEAKVEKYWWGKHIGAENYKKLYRLIVDYLRNNDVDNVIYSWSVNDMDYSYYPGDDYVDVFSIEGDKQNYDKGLEYKNTLNKLSEIFGNAIPSGKIVILTE